MRRLLLGIALAVGLGLVPVNAAAGSHAVIQFSADYSGSTPQGDIFFDCSGIRAVDAYVLKDTETCTVTGAVSGFVAGTYFGRPNAVVPPLGLTGWGSDYDGRIATMFVQRIVANGDGSLTIRTIAFYS